MSKKSGARTGALVSVFVIFAAAVLFISPVSRSRAQGGGIAPSTKNAAVIATTAAILKETSDLRELPILHPVKSGAKSRPEIERMIIDNLDEDSTPEDLRHSELAMKKMGLVPMDFKLRPFLINILAEQVAGYYDPKVEEFYLADWIDLDGQKPVMVHELTHALQDQHFNLRRFEKWPKGDSDAELAAHALIEGDATLAMTLYVEKNPWAALALARSLRSSGTSSEQIDHAPRALRESLLFPYEHGYEWAKYLYKQAGWANVSHAFKELPQSTEQILHPEKYLAHKAPVKVSLPEIASTLGAGWKRIDYDVNGEWTYYLILDEYLKSESESKRAAAGWAGDRFALYEGPRHGDLLIAQLTVWDTERDAVEFFDAYTKRTQRRYSDASPLDELGVPGTRGWHTSEGKVTMERRGLRVLILEGVPDRQETARLLRKLWQSSGGSA
jgi:hypothetical protein